VFVDENSYVDFEHGFLPEFWGKAYVKFPIMYGICCCIVIPLCLLKDISKMRVASMFSIFSLIYTICVIIIECPMYFSKFLETTDINDINWFNIGTGFTYKLYFFTGTATVFFAYTCHAGAFPVYKSLKNNVTRRVNKVFRRSILLDAVIYTLVGVTGFLTQPVHTPDLIIYRKGQFSNDLALIIGQLLIAFNLILSSPANYNAFRLSIMEIIGWDNNNISNKQ
jgi:amino acid permease